MGDVPTGWTKAPANNGSIVADPRSYLSCGRGPATPNDVAFQRSTAGPFVGETFVAFPSASEAHKGLTDEEDRTTSCTASDPSTQFAVAEQTLASTYGDESKAYKFTLTTANGPAIGYVILVRKSNLLAWFLSFDFTGGDGLSDVERAASLAVGRLGT